MIVGTLEGQHHLAAALVRDLGFAEYSLDTPLYEMALVIDPYVIIGEQTIANLRAGGRLSQVIRNVPTWKAARQRWPELERLLGNLEAAMTLFRPGWRITQLQRRASTGGRVVVTDLSNDTDAAVVSFAGGDLVGIAGRASPVGELDHVIDEAPVVDQEVAIVTWVRSKLHASSTPA
jgi:hypothetical protein